MTGCYHLLEWYLKDGYRYRCKLEAVEIGLEDSDETKRNRRRA